MAEETPKTQNKTPKGSATVDIPDGTVLVRKTRGPQGPHPLLGFALPERLYHVTVAEAAALTENGGDFDVVPEFAEVVKKEIAARAEAQKKK